MENTGTIQGSVSAMSLVPGSQFIAQGLPVKQDFLPFDCVLAYPITRVYKGDESILVNTHEIERFEKCGWCKDEIDRDSNKLDVKTDKKE